MRSNIAAFLSGSLFGVGLLVSGMTKPAKVSGFLDVLGSWDASLLFVMMGAIAVHFVLHRVIVKRATPLFSTRFDLAELKTIDASLVGGAALFGVGWGLGGYCPGPAIVALGAGTLPVIVFVACMAIGVVLQRTTATWFASERAAAPRTSEDTVAAEE